jgi:hypothetical protein
MKKYKTKNGLISTRRYSNVQRIDIFPNEYAIRDYKTKKLLPIEKISIGRWKFLENILINFQILIGGI